MSWSEPRADDSNPLAQPDLVDALERQIAAGFPLGLALDLVLNELVVRAATATRASSAALALRRDDEMVCRAATGQHAPDLGIPINTLRAWAVGRPRLGAKSADDVRPYDPVHSDSLAAVSKSASNPVVRIACSPIEMKDFN
jgi:hypothetical protein